MVLLFLEADDGDNLEHHVLPGCNVQLYPGSHIEKQNLKMPKSRKSVMKSWAAHNGSATYSRYRRGKSNRVGALHENQFLPDEKITELG